MQLKGLLFNTASAAILMAAVACSRDNSTTQVNPGNNTNTDKTEIKNLVISPQFSFATTQSFSFRLETILPSGDDFVKAGNVQILNANPRVKGSAAEVIAEGTIDDNGQWVGSLTIPSSLEKLYIKPNYIGLIDLLEVDVRASAGGTYVKSLVVDENYTGGIDGGVDSTFSGARTGTSNYNYVCNYNNQGKPNCLNNTNEVFTSQFLQSVNLSLPEGSPVSSHHPQYINPSAVRHLKLIAAASVEVGFISEGAGYLNALGYYTYPLNNPPTTPPSITSSSVKVIFPNASYSGSGGQLVAGNKVSLGTFPAGTGIGWFLVADGYNNNQKKVIEDSWKKTMFSVDSWNPAAAANLKQQLIMLNDPTSQRMILAFEDIRRDDAGCDHDFNDCVFFAKATPASAVDPTDVPEVDNGPRDRDGDGVADASDDYPDDNQRAHNVYPNGTGYSTLAFEDLWPSEGDYDFNDYVVNYNYKLVTNAQNNVKDIVARYKVRAIGASYRNGFAVSFDGINQSAVSQVIGGRLTANKVTRRANGTEDGINNAVIWVTDDARNSVSGGSGQFVNTQPGEGVYTSDTIGVVVRFGTAVSPSSLGASPFNPFITCDLAGSSLGVTNLLAGAEVRRGVEVHLVDKPSTSKAITRLFGTKSDNSVPANNRYYKTAKNLPFGLNIPVDFNYPIEKNQVTKAHLKFGAWAESNGTQFPDWYLNNPGYRDATKIY